MKRILLLPVMALAVACGSQQLSDSDAVDLNNDVSVTPAPRNIGTQIWLAPAPAGDLMKLAQQPELWPEAQERVDVISLYALQAYHHEGYQCGTPCGPNTYPELMKAVPGGMYRWLSDRFALAMEAPSVKEYSCTEEGVRKAALTTNIAIRNISTSGGRLTYLSLDEPFTAGLPPRPASSAYGCGLDVRQVAELQREFNEIVHATYPEVQIGLIEPYPYFSPDEIMSFVLELEAADIPIKYFHLDMDLQSVVSQHCDIVSDATRFRNFFQARGIPFGIILWGGDGSSNKAFATETWMMTRVVAAVVGVTEHTVFQSWSESKPGNPSSPRVYPNTVPETDPDAHAGLLLRVRDFLKIKSVQ